MQHQEFDPPEQLRDAIKCIWYNSKESGELPSSFEVVPDGYAEIIFYFGSLSSAAYNGGLQPLPSPFLLGLQNQPAIFYTRNHLQIIAIRCHPWTVFDLLGLQPGKHDPHIVEHPIARLQPELNKWINAGKIEEAITEVKRYLLTAQTQVAVDNTLHKAGEAMQNAGGAIPVSQVAAAAHATVRTLERKFKQSSGYTVKDVSGLMRFERVRNQLWLNPETNLAGLAHELGYTDQSHLGREFKQYSGTTPAAFARKAKKEKQELGEDFVAFIHS